VLRNLRRSNVYLGGLVSIWKQATAAYRLRLSSGDLAGGSRWPEALGWVKVSCSSSLGVQGQNGELTRQRCQLKTGIRRIVKGSVTMRGPLRCGFVLKGEGEKRGWTNISVTIAGKSPASSLSPGRRISRRGGDEGKT